MSWNVNGLRAVMQKGFPEFLHQECPTILGIQETKLQAEQIPPEMLAPEGYHVFWSHAERKGYSGTAIFSRIKPDQVLTDTDLIDFGQEGRIVRADFGKVTLFNVYFPNGKRDDVRLQYKLDFYNRFSEMVFRLRDEGRHVLVCGDVNTAHQPIDLKNPKENENVSGFLKIEREWIDLILANGFVDTFRAFDDRSGQYSWWSYLGRARDKNAGWRIDYFFASTDFMPYVKRAFIRQDVLGSDHCPVGIEVDDSVFQS
jgi:exodeoxyribonuclease-3